MTKDQEKLYEMYMKMSKKELAEMLAIINTCNNIYPTSVPMQPGLYPPNPPYECPPWRPQEIWYTNNTNNSGDAPRRYESNIN
jgi:hypothetical protein